MSRTLALFVIPNLFRDNKIGSPVILKQVQDNALLGHNI
jgi:hypothetical protein